MRILVESDGHGTKVYVNDREIGGCFDHVTIDIEPLREPIIRATLHEREMEKRDQSK